MFILIRGCLQLLYFNKDSTLSSEFDTTPMKQLTLLFLVFLSFFSLHKNSLLAQSSSSCVPAYFIDNPKNSDAKLFSLYFDKDKVHLTPISTFPITNSHIGVSTTGDTVYIVHGRNSTRLSYYVVSRNFYQAVGEVLTSTGTSVGKVTQVGTNSKGELYVASSNKHRLYKVNSETAIAQDLGRIYHQGNNATIKISGGDLTFDGQNPQLLYIATKGNDRTTGSKARGIYKVEIQEGEPLRAVRIGDCLPNTTGIATLEQGYGNLLYSEATTNRFYEVDREGNIVKDYRAYLADQLWDIDWGDMSLGCFTTEALPTESAYWNFNTCDDQSLIDSVNSYQFLVHGTAPKEGYTGQGRSFDGIGDYLEQTEANFSDTQFTFSLWFKSDYTGDFQTLVSKQTDYRDRNYWLSLWKQGVSPYQGGALVFRSAGANGTIDIGTSTNYSDGQWHHVAVTVSSTETVLYVDGQKQASQFGVGLSTNNTPFLVGVESKNGTLHRFFRGELDELRFYREALQGSQIRQLSKQTSSPEDCFRISCGSAVEVIDFQQGLRKNGQPVVSNRSNPQKSLGTPERDNTINFVSLGYGGELIIKLAEPLGDGPGPDIEIIETSFDNRACGNRSEKAAIYGSKYGQNWVFVGESCIDTKLNLSTAGIDWIQYVKIVDRTDPSFFDGGSDGFDVDGIVCLNGLITTPTIATPPIYCQGDTIQPLIAQGNDTLRWYTDTTSTYIGEGTTYQPTISATTTFYVRQEINGHVSTFVSVEVIIYPSPSVTYTSFIAADINEVVSFDLVASGTYTYNWTGPNGFSSVLANPLIPVTPSSYGEYTLTVNNGTCQAIYEAIIAEQGVFATLKENLDASYYHTNREGKLYFKFDEKYGLGTTGMASVSTFNYDFQEVNQVLLSKEYGYNWYGLDLSSFATEGDHYILHIKDELDRRYALRVKYATGNNAVLISEDSEICISDNSDFRSIRLDAKSYVDTSPYSIKWYTSTDINQINQLESLSEINRENWLFAEYTDLDNQLSSAYFETNQNYKNTNLIYAPGEDMYYVRAIITDYCGNETYSNTITVNVYLGTECTPSPNERVSDEKHRFEIFFSIRRLLSPNTTPDPTTPTTK